MAMLLQSARYSAANALARALLSQLIAPEMWAEIIDAADAPGVLRLLRMTRWGAGLSPLADVEAGPAQVERILTETQARVALLPCTLLQGQPQALVEWFWRRFEVSNLKAILRGVQRQTPPSQVEATLIALGARAMAKWADLVAVRSIPALVERLSELWYGRVLRRGLDQAIRQHSIFPLEATLDLAYFGELLTRMQRLHGQDHADAAAFLGQWVDSQNLLWAYRYRLNAGLSPEEILNYTMQTGLRVNAGVVRTIALGAPLMEIVGDLWPRLAGLEELATLAELEALPQLEQLFQRQLFKQAQAARAGFPLRLASILAFEFLLEYEVRDLTAALEGKTMGWSGERIRPYLIGQRGE